MPDPNIKVELTSDSDRNPMSFVLHLGSMSASMTALTMVDLIHKCNLALCQWQAHVAGELVRELMNRGKDRQ